MNYCEIFKTGVHTSANGNKKEWTTGDLDKIVEKFNEKKPTTPIVIGHPKSNNPAYGWVDSVKRDGEKLLATFKQVNNEFAEWVNKGLYKNRSISLYPDLTLRHVGFLGAVPPAVKGLAEYQFEENQDYEEYTELEERNDNVELEELQKQNQEFSEQISSKDAKIEELEKKIAEQEKEKRLAEHEQFAEELLKSGSITPAQKPIIVDFMEVCANQGTYDFAESEEKDCLKAFKNLFKGIKQIEFSEIATNGKQKEADEIDFEDPKAIAKAIKKRKAEYAKEGKNVSEDVILAELKKGQGEE